MKTQIVLDRAVDFSAVATFLVESTDRGFVPVANTPLYSADFERVMTGWQALGGLLAPLKPQPSDQVSAILARFHMVQGVPSQTVVWTGG